MKTFQDILMKRSYIIHIICWGILILFPILLIEHTSNTHGELMRYIRHSGMPLGFMLVFYANYVYLIPRFMFKEKMKAYYLLNVLVLIVACLLFVLWEDVFFAFVPDMHPMDMHHHQPPHWPVYSQYMLSLILFIGLSVAIRMSERWVKAEAARKEAENSRTEAELRNLRNQLNPHFLLNTLNNIYALIAFDANKAQKVVEELSKLLRHVLYDNQGNFVPLYSEAEFMRNYIELMRIRVTDNVKIDTDIDVGADNATPIAPLLFISLIENAFKHGISPSEPSYINIRIAEDHGDITCDIRNSNFPKKCNDKSGSGIGLEQVSKRLELMYHGRYTWEKSVSPDGKDYSSKIVIYHDTDMRHRG
jgi:two-component sensor histidine kinase